jgi:hypothetical protein
MEGLASGRSSSFRTASEVFSITELVVDYAQHAKAYCGNPNKVEGYRLSPAAPS